MPVMNVKGPLDGHLTHRIMSGPGYIDSKPFRIPMQIVRVTSCLRRGLIFGRHQCSRLRSAEMTKAANRRRVTKGLKMRALFILAMSTFTTLFAGREVYAQYSDTFTLERLRSKGDTPELNGVDLKSGQLEIRRQLLAMPGTNLGLTFSLSQPTGNASGSSSDIPHLLGCMMNAALVPSWGGESTFNSRDHGVLSSWSTPLGGGKFTGYGEAQGNGTYFAASLDYNRSFLFGSDQFVGLNFRGPDGTVAEVKLPAQGSNFLLPDCTNPFGNPYARFLPVKRMAFPNAETWTIFHQEGVASMGSANMPIYRIKYVVSNRGYALHYQYYSNTSGVNFGRWLAPTKITAYNKKSVSCNESELLDCPGIDASTHSVSFSYDTIAKTVLITEYGKSTGLQLAFEASPYGTNRLQLKQTRDTFAAGSEISYAYSLASAGEVYNIPYVSRVTRDGKSWHYTHSREAAPGNIESLGWGTRTNPDGSFVSGRGHYGMMLNESGLDELARGSGIAGILQFPRQFAVQAKMESRITKTGWDIYTVKLDRRNNVKEVITLKDGADRSQDLIYSAIYSSDCPNPIVCNNPLSITDERGAITNFTYDQTHGGLLRKTLPPDSSGVRAETRYTYRLGYPWLRSGAGFVQSTPGIWLLESEEYCRTSAADGGGNCASGPSDKVRTTYEYEEGASTKGSNLLLLGIALIANGQTRRTCYSYDAGGRRISETSPMAGLAVCP